MRKRNVSVGQTSTSSEMRNLIRCNFLTSKKRNRTLWSARQFLVSMGSEWGNWKFGINKTHYLIVFGLLENSALSDNTGHTKCFRLTKLENKVFGLVKMIKNSFRSWCNWCARQLWCSQIISRHSSVLTNGSFLFDFRICVEGLGEGNWFRAGTI